MSITIDVPPELETELSAEAERLNLTLPEYVLHILTTHQAASSTPKNGAELVEYWHREGLIGTQPTGVDSPAYARTLRRIAERRIRD